MAVKERGADFISYGVQRCGTYRRSDQNRSHPAPLRGQPGPIMQRVQCCVQVFCKYSLLERGCLVTRSKNMHAIGLSSDYHQGEKCGVTEQCMHVQRLIYRAAEQHRTIAMHSPPQQRRIAALSAYGLLQYERPTVSVWPTGHREGARSGRLR